jgi:glycosyltransferase involved in cell wall biosynthesis
MLGTPIHKNLKRAIEAIVQLNKSTKSPVLFVISCSRSVFTARLEKLISEAAAEEYVKFAGFVPDYDLSVLMKKSLGFLYPSFEEGFGLPGLEAMTNGTLVVCSDIPVFKEVYKDNALYFNPFDYTSIATQLKAVTEMDLDTRRERIKKAKDHAKQFSWTKMAQETINVYEEAVS